MNPAFVAISTFAIFLATPAHVSERERQIAPTAVCGAGCDHCFFGLITDIITSPASERSRAASQAKVQLSHSMRLIGQQGVQLHGGIGITDEYIMSHYFNGAHAARYQLR